MIRAVKKVNIPANSLIHKGLLSLSVHHVLLANAVYLPGVPPGPETGGKSEGAETEREDQGREGGSEAFSWGKINIHFLSSLWYSPYLNVRLNLACGLCIFSSVMSSSRVSGTGPAVCGETSGISALIGNTDRP